MSQKRTVLQGQTRRMVYNVLTFMSKEAQDGFQIDLKAVQRRTAAATGISIRTIRRIAATVKDSGDKSSNIRIFRTPAKKRPGKKKVTGIDNFDRGIIKRIIQNFYETEDELPTFKTILNKVKQIIRFDGSTSSIRRISKDLGFKCKRADENKTLLIEHTNIRLKRIEYLRKITKYREEGRPIVYADETYVDFANTTSMNWSDGYMESIKKNTTKGQRLIIVHAGSEDGFIPNALLMFKAGSKIGDYLTDFIYEKWIREQLLPNLPRNSVLVLDNAPYHNQLDDAAPTPNCKKSEMESWLLERNIPYNSAMLKPELYKLIRLHKDTYKKYIIDRILAQKNHTVLRIPPYHPDLNPIDMAWSAIKLYVTQRNLTCKIDNVIKLVAERVGTLQREDWSAYYDKVKNIEEEYKMSDVNIDILTEDFMMRDDDTESESDEERLDSEEDDSSSDEEAPSFYREEVFIEDGGEDTFNKDVEKPEDKDIF